MQAPCTRTRPCDRAFAALRRIAHCALATQTAAPRTMSEAAKKRLAKEAEAKQKKKRGLADARAAYKEKLKRPKHDLEPSSDEDEPQKSDEDDDDDSHGADN